MVARSEASIVNLDFLLPCAWTDTSIVARGMPAIATKRLVRPGSKQEFSDYWSAHKHLIDSQIQSAGVGTNIDDFHKNWIAFQRLQLSSLSKNDRYRIISNAILNAIDPHSEYIDPVGYRNEPLRGTDLHAWQHIANVGIESRRFNGAHIVFAVQPGSPADIENIRPGSEIIAVIKDHVSLTVTNLDDLSLRRLLEGSEGSEVTLIVRDSDDPNIIRPVDLKYSALYSSQVGITSEIVSGNQVNIASSRHVGILKIPFFYDELSENIKPYLAEYKTQNIDTVIIDLRNNGGGSLAESTRFSGLFINSGPVMQIRYSTGKIAVNKDTDDKSYFDGNLIVLVNSHTAGSCEIFAAAMQDYGRAIIVGETTFGMGSVRQHRGLGRTYDFYDAPMGSIQFTLATYYRVNGDGMQLKGVTPDIAFPMTNKYKLREQDNPYAIPWEATRAVEYEKSADLEATINQLKNISTELDPNAIDPELSKTIEMAFSLSSEKN